MPATPSLGPTLLAVALWLAASTAIPAVETPSDWIDADTGHRVIRLSSEPGSASLYFHQNTYTPEGDKLIFDSPSGIAALELATIGSATQKVVIVVSNA